MEMRIQEEVPMGAVDTPGILKLPRGGRVVETSSGRVQFGVPPETIKDTLESDLGVPRTFILPPDMFSLEAGFSLAELEFPIYYNFFFKSQTIRVICTREQQKRVLTVLKEAVFGPELVDFEREFVNGAQTPGYPDLAAEMTNFKTIPVNGTVRPLEVDDVIEFYRIAPESPACLGNLEVSLDLDDTYTLTDQGEVVAVFSSRQELIPEIDTEFSSDQVFYPPLFGVTTLGSGHGFAPDAETSGMIIWINRRGIMVDPPVNSALELVRLGVSPKILDSIILTHCHADHDAGTLQKIMQEGSITLYTTPTIFNSFIRKSSALTDIPAALLEQAVRFVPLIIGAAVNINGGIFQFSYALHSIPTISIQAGYGGKTMIYTSDTHNDPGFADQLYEKGIASENRRDFLKNFPWNRDMIFHEAGLPPLHTPMSVLEKQPDDVKERMYLLHVTRDMIPENADLKIAATGLSETLSLDVAPPEFCRPVEILGTYLDQALFNCLPPEKTMEFLCIAQTRYYPPGAAIIEQGDIGDHVFMIMTGLVAVQKDGQTLTTFGRGDFFGEKCLFSTAPRTATVTATSDVRLIAIRKKEMLAFIRNTPVEEVLFHLSAVQNKPLRDLLDMNSVFRHLTPSQKTQLFQILSPAAGPAKEDTTVICRGEPSDACYFVAKGRVRVVQGDTFVATLGPGALFGTWMIFDETAPSSFSFIAGPETSLFRIAGKDLTIFVKNNPGVFLKLYNHVY